MRKLCQEIYDRRNQDYPDPSEYQSSDENEIEEYPLCYAKDEKEVENE